MSDTMREPGTKPRARSGGGAGGAADAVYGLGLIGSLIFFWQQADSFWQYVLAVLEALVWPAILVYRAFEALPH